MKKTKSKFLIGFSIAALFLVAIGIYGRKSAFPAKADTATIFTQMDYDTYRTGNHFQVRIILDTGGQDIVAAQAIANYATDTIQIDSIDDSASDFDQEVLKTNDAQNGQIFIALGKPSPGVNSATANIAIVNVTALKGFTGVPVLTLKFDSSDAISDSAAIVDDGNGTNVLQSVSNEFVNTGADTTPPTLSTVTAVSAKTRSHVPIYTFNSTEGGTIQYGVGCSSGVTTAVAGDNTITLDTLSVGTHSNCTIQVTDGCGNQNTAFNVGTFVVTYRSDFNLDQTVDMQDYGTFHANYANNSCGNTADMNGDCHVDMQDYGVLHSEYGSHF